jgi:hypothetical protein
MAATKDSQSFSRRLARKENSRDVDDATWVSSNDLLFIGVSNYKDIITAKEN